MLLLVLATMPVVWTDGGNMKLYSDDRGFFVRPGFKKPGKSKDRVNRTDEVARLAELRKWLGDPESLPADLLAALQQSAPNASSSEIVTPAEHTPEVRAELIEPLACTA